MPTKRTIGDEATEVLRTWLLSPAHFSHPYPTAQEREDLARRAGITPQQVLNWFVNVRKRVWQPLLVQMGVDVKEYISNGRCCSAAKRKELLEGIGKEELEEVRALAAAKTEEEHQRLLREQEKKREERSSVVDKVVGSKRSIDVIQNDSKGFKSGSITKTATVQETQASTPDFSTKRPRLLVPPPSVVRALASGNISSAAAAAAALVRDSSVSAPSVTQNKDGQKDWVGRKPQLLSSFSRQHGLSVRTSLRDDHGSDSEEEANSTYGRHSRPSNPKLSCLSPASKRKTHPASISISPAAEPVGTLISFKQNSEDNDSVKKLGSVDEEAVFDRKGHWTKAEEYYAQCIILAFSMGALPLPDRMTLRTFLSKQLKCPPMRISKKFVGDEKIGRILYKRKVVDAQKQAKLLEELDRARKNFLHSIGEPMTSESSRSSSGDLESLKDTKKQREDGEAQVQKSDNAPCHISDGDWSEERKFGELEHMWGMNFGVSSCAEGLEMPLPFRSSLDEGISMESQISGAASEFPRATLPRISSAASLSLGDLDLDIGMRLSDHIAAAFNFNPQPASTTTGVTGTDQSKCNVGMMPMKTIDDSAKTYTSTGGAFAGEGGLFGRQSSEMSMSSELTNSTVPASASMTFTSTASAGVPPSPISVNEWNEETELLLDDLCFGLGGLENEESMSRKDDAAHRLSGSDLQQRVSVGLGAETIVGAFATSSLAASTASSSTPTSSYFFPPASTHASSTLVSAPLLAIDTFGGISTSMQPVSFLSAFPAVSTHIPQYPFLHYPPPTDAVFPGSYGGPTGNH